MKHEYKERWLAALRNGEYEQGTGALREGTKYCCLGVLTEVSGEAKHMPSWTEAKVGALPVFLFGKHADDVYARYDYQDYKLASFSLQWLHLFGLSKEEQTELINLNDGAGCKRYSFTEIADWIEKYL